MAKDWQNVNQLIEYPNNGIISKELVKNDKANVTLFCMAKETEISEHTATKEGYVYVIEGEGIFNLEGQEIKMNPKVFIYLKKNAVHSLKAKENTTFILFLINN